MQLLMDFILNIDQHLVSIVNQFGALSYAIVFLIIFCETGLVVAPFLPGDSLLFAIGALSTKGAFNLWLVYPLLIVAAVGGDALNYYIGHKLGRKAFGKIPFLELEYLEKTESTKVVNRTHGTYISIYFCTSRNGRYNFHSSKFKIGIL